MRLRRLTARLMRAAHTAARGPPAPPAPPAWRFGCTQCGRCCHHGKDRRVLLSADEAAAIARHTATSPSVFVRHVPETASLALQTRAGGACVFLGHDNKCDVHPVRPTQCRTYPFWSEILTPLGWLRESARCEGIGRPDMPPVSAEEVAVNAVLADLAISGESTTYDSDRTLLAAVPDAVAAHFAELQAAGGAVRLDTDELCVVDAPDDDGRLRRTLVLKSAPALDQSVVFLANDAAVIHDELAMPVHRTLALAPLLLQRAPARILVVGGGGCSLPLALAHTLPTARVTVVELSATVAAAAREWFVAGTGVELEIADGAAFLRVPGEPTYDLIVLDAASATASPAPELSTPDFIAAVQRRLSRGGMLAANTFGNEATAGFERLVSRTFQTGAAALELPEDEGGAEVRHTVVFAQNGWSGGTAAADAWRRVCHEAADDVAAAGAVRLAGPDVLRSAATGLRRCVQ